MINSIKSLDDDVEAQQQLVEEQKRSTVLQDNFLVVWWRKFSYWWGTALAIFALFVVIYGIIKEWNNPPWEHIHPAMDLVIFLILMTWIALLEGCQISIVGLQNIDVEPYKESHPRAYEICKLAHKGPNVERFLTGRQFLLLFNGFLVSRIGGGTQADFYIGSWHWSTEATQFFYLNSILLMIVIVGPTQLVTQLIANDKMLGFLNLRFFGLYTVLYPCLFVESLGFTHSAYVLKDLLTWVAGIDTSQADPAKIMKKGFLYWIRAVFSLSCIIFSGVFIGKGLYYNQTGATDGAGWNKLPGWAATLVSLFFVFMMACAEGSQVALLALANTRTSKWKDKSPKAYHTTQIVFAGRNMNAYLVGRQFITAMMMVLLGRVTGYVGSGGIIEGEDWGMGRGFNEYLLQYGFLGAIFVVNVAQLASQITASIFPISFLNNYFIRWLIQLMLLIEAMGIVNVCWPLARFVVWAIGLPADPFDEKADTPANQILARKKSMGIPATEGGSPFALSSTKRDNRVSPAD